MITDTPVPPRSGGRRPSAPSSPSESALVELRIRGAPVPHWMQDLGTRWNAGVRLHVCRRVDGDLRQLLQLLEITTVPESVPEVAAFLRGRVAPEDLAITRLAPNRLLVRVVGPLPALCHSVFEMGAICMSCPFLPASPDPEGEGRSIAWRVLVQKARDAHPLLDSFSEPGTPPASLVRIGAYRAGSDLTPRQELAVSTAFALGYYDTPRRSQLKDVARALGVSRATAMENLRRGMRKLASQRRGEPGRARTVGADAPDPTATER
ncbi:MAG TPA: helix-turn-helix domain-containing protein [Thermoplasmata archaeon]|nr:helix-turn-helix domain-containing protein [Thermoplasmata archaeon]